MNIHLQRAVDGVMLMMKQKPFIIIIRNIVVRKIPGTHSIGSRVSDHRFLNFTFNISKSNKGPDFWKFNTSVFDDKKYKSIDRWSILSIK